MAGGRQRPKVKTPKATRLPGVTPLPRAANAGLTIVSWNIAWAYGWGSDGSGITSRLESDFERNLKEMGRVLKQLNPDIVLLQEADFESTRSHGIDQAHQLARVAHLPYVAKAISWRANWVPFPYWPPENHFGTMLSGGAILSRYPIEEHRVETVPKPDALPWWYNLFYLFRYHQEAVIQTDFGPVLVMNVHAEAFDEENRIQHARLIAERLSDHIIPQTVVGGDFNSVLPEASVREGYPDEPGTSHSSDPTIEIIRGIDGLMDTVPGELYLKDEAAWLTFPAYEPNRKLDYLFYGAGFRADKTHIPRATAGDLSDHLPIVTTLYPIL